MSKVIRQGAICLLSAGLAAGCAAGSSGGVAAQTVMVSALTHSESASTFHISATEHMKPLSGTPILSMNSVSMWGDVDLSTHSSHLRATLVGAFPAPGGGPQSISFEMIQIGGDTWDSTTGLGALGTSAPPGHWVKDDSSSSGSIPDPAKLFAALKAAAAKVTFVASGTVGGAKCNEYRLLGTAGLFDALNTGSSDQTTANGPVAIDVWVDQSNLVRRLSTTVDQNMGGPGQVDSVALTVDFTGYGEAVHIEPPPSSLVVANP